MPAGPRPYIGRFAPSPTGPLHAGSVVAALASWLDARSHGGHARWLVRIEDLDRPRCVAGAAEHQLRQLQALGLVADAAPLYQSQRLALYQAALERLRTAGLAYPCACSRADIEAAIARAGVNRVRHGERVYPGTCRNGMQGRGRPAWRLRVDAVAAPGTITRWPDRRLGGQQQDVALEVGDFVLLRADAIFSYQLAVVVDDGAQGVSHVVRGADLADNTARQLLLQTALDLPPPQYLHTPLVRDTRGEKLSKQNGAVAINEQAPLAALNAAAAVLDLPPQHGSLADALAAWVRAWAGLYNPGL